MVVVDTNLIVSLYVATVHSPRAEALLLREPDWAAPLLWRSEFRNVLAGCLRRDRLTIDDAWRIVREAESLMSGAEHEVDSLGVLQLARDSGCTAYDCEFVSLAAQLDVPLMTMDSGLLKAFPERAVSPEG